MWTFDTIELGGVLLNWNSKQDRRLSLWRRRSDTLFLQDSRTLLVSKSHLGINFPYNTFACCMDNYQRTTKKCILVFRLDNSTHTRTIFARTNQNKLRK